jgi:hypothetical protein
MLPNNSTCVEPENCPIKYYPDDTDNKCLPCKNTCLTCENSFECKSCDTSLNFTFNSSIK